MKEEAFFFREVIASTHVSNSMSVNVYGLNHQDEKILVGYSGDKPRWHKLYNSVRRGVYFVLRRRKWYLDEFIRTGYPEINEKKG